MARFFPSGVSVGGQSRCFSQISMIKDTHHQFYTAACKPDRARRHPLCWICLWFTSPMIPKVFLLLIVICFIHRHLQTLIRSVLTVTLSPDVLLPIRGACGSFLHRLHYNLPSHCRCFRPCVVIVSRLCLFWRFSSSHEGFRKYALLLLLSAPVAVLPLIAFLSVTLHSECALTSYCSDTRIDRVCLLTTSLALSRIMQSIASWCK